MLMNMTPKRMAILLVLGVVFSILDTIHYCFYFLPEFYGDPQVLLHRVFTFDGAVAYFKSATGLILTALCFLPYIIMYIGLRFDKYDDNDDS